MEQVKEFCCELKSQNELVKIWYFDTYEEALEKMFTIQNIDLSEVEIYVGKTENKDRKRTKPLVVKESFVISGDEIMNDLKGKISELLTEEDLDESEEEREDE